MLLLCFQRSIIILFLKSGSSNIKKKDLRTFLPLGTQVYINGYDNPIEIVEIFSIKNKIYYDYCGQTTIDEKPVRIYFNKSDIVQEELDDYPRKGMML